MSGATFIEALDKMVQLGFFRVVCGRGIQRTEIYQENDITAAKFGSKHWWAVQGWQSGGSSSNPR